MSERKSGFNKNMVLKTLSDNIRKADSLPVGIERDTFERLIGKYSALAEEMGATNFDITDVHFSATEEKDRQDLFDTYCQQLWTACDDFGSFEELRSWADDMIKIRDKYKLKDTLTTVKEYVQSDLSDDNFEPRLLTDINPN